MSFHGILILLLWEVLLPVLAGTIFISVWRPVTESLPGRVMASWISGQFLLFALFQLVSVPLTLKGKNMDQLMSLMEFLLMGVLALALVRFVTDRIRRRDRAEVATLPKSRGQIALWGIALLLLILQLVLSVVTTYADGDDAYYIAVATAAGQGNTLFTADAYTGFGYGLNYRYALASFPLWIGMLSRISGIGTAAVAHSCFAPQLILLAYGGFGLLGSLVLKERRQFLPVFLIAVEILVLFGDFSNMVPENFLLARSRQGKAALATLVIPMCFWLLYQLVEWLQEKGKFTFLHWLLLEAVVLTACMCSTIGAVLCCLLFACVGLSSAVMTRKIRHLPVLALLCAPCLIYLGLYVIRG